MPNTVSTNETGKQATSELYNATKNTAAGAYDASKAKVHKTDSAIADATAETSVDDGAKADYIKYLELSNRLQLLDFMLGREGFEPSSIGLKESGKTA